MYSLQPYFLSLITGYPQLQTIESFLMLCLGLMVALVSFVELSAILYESLQIKGDGPAPVSEIRTYDN
jgi:hypothetical protein